MRTSIVTVAVCFLAVALFGQAVGHTTGNFKGCPPEGEKPSGGFYDATLDELKNRDIAPTSYVDRDLAAIIANKPAAVVAEKETARGKWTPDALDAVKGWESEGARVEGRLIAIHHQGTESCNCKGTAGTDLHIWIATQASSNAKATQSMVVEISPRTPKLQALYDQLLKLSHSGTAVRISGWMLWDEEHGSEVGKARGTLWEIHPIHVIEVNQNGTWVTLGQE